MVEKPNISPELREALDRLRWVVPGRDYSDLMIADVETVLNHFGMTNAHGNDITTEDFPVSEER